MVIKAFATRFAMSVIVHGHGRACSRKDYVVPDALKEGCTLHTMGRITM